MVGPISSAIRRRLNQSQDEAELDTFSPLIARRHKGRQPSFNFEFDLLGHVVRSSSDIFRLRKTTLKKCEPLEISALRFVTVNFKRSDIPDQRNRGPWPDKFFVWKNIDSFCFTEVNTEASPRYDRGAWIQLRETALAEAIKLEPDLITFGEYDYPAQEHPSEPANYENDIRTYDANIRRLIDSAKSPLMFLAGSRHEVTHSGPDALRLCSNVAYFYLNQKARDDARTGLTHIRKKSAAKKVGEVLSSIPGINLEIFGTAIGNVAVLVCSDAYDPIIIGEMVMNSRWGHPDRVDYFIVPSYNGSGKLVKSCQVLSYFTSSAVLYCNSYLRNGDFDLSELFLCGERIQAWKINPKFKKLTLPKIKTHKHAEFDLCCFDLDQNFMREVIDHSKRTQSEPLNMLLKKGNT